MTNKPSWDDLKSEYATTEISYRKMAEKYNMSASTITKMAATHKWSEARKSYRSKLVAKTVEKAVEEKSDKLALIARSADKMGEVIQKVMDDEDQFFRRLNENTQEEYRTKKVDSRAIRDMTAAIKELTAVFRNVYNIPTEAENLSMKLARERLEIEKRNSAIDDLNYGVNAGVVLIPPVEEEDDDE